MSDRRFHGAVIFGWVVIAICMAAGVLLSGCATAKADAKAVAEVCRPELMPDAEQALLPVGELLVCEAAGGSCSVQSAAVESLGRADAVQCALAELHAGVVRLAAPEAGAP